MTDLSKTIETLQNVQRMEQIQDILSNWEHNFKGEYVDFEIFMYTFDEVNDYRRPLIKAKDIKTELAHYKDMMEVSYPRTRELNKLVKEYNSLSESLSGICFDYLKDEVSRLMNRMQNN